MNYRHSFHAGNHTEVFKHAVLINLIFALQKKAAPLFLLDTHAGIGSYNLASDDALKTREADEGIFLVLANSALSLQPYLQRVRAINRGALNVYPGSPRLIAETMRDSDRTVLSELHPDDFLRLKANMKSYRGVTILNRDGYEVLVAMVPPRERRGLVFIDPPFEEPDEMSRLTRALIDGYEKWKTGVFVCWYPIKRAQVARALKAELQAQFVKSALCVEFLKSPISDERLAGSGMIILNAPWKFDELARQLCADLAMAFGSQGASWDVEWVCEPI